MMQESRSHRSSRAAELSEDDKQRGSQMIREQPNKKSLSQTCVCYGSPLDGESRRQERLDKMSYDNSGHHMHQYRNRFDSVEEHNTSSNVNWNNLQNQRSQQHLSDRGVEIEKGGGWRNREGSTSFSWRHESRLETSNSADSLGIRKPQRLNGPKQPWKKTIDLAICLPISIPSGKILVQSLEGENFYIFDNDDCNIGLQFFFSSDKGIGDAWASFLQVRVGLLSNIPVSIIPDVINLFRDIFNPALKKDDDGLTDIRNSTTAPSSSEAVDSLNSKNKLLPDLLSKDSGSDGIFDCPLKMSCKGIAGRYTKESAYVYETRLFPNTDQDEAKLLWILNRLQKFNKEINLTFDTLQPPKNNTSINNNLLISSCTLIDEANNMKATAFTDGLPLVFREYGTAGMDGPVFDELMQIFDSQNLMAKGCEISEIRLEYLSKRMVDPRFLPSLVLTRQVAGNEQNNRVQRNSTDEEPLIGRIVFCQCQQPEIISSYSLKDLLNSKHGFLYKWYLAKADSRD